MTTTPPALQRPPARWRKELEGVLITEVQLAERISQLARKIQKDYKGKDLVVISILNGTVLFSSDLIRQISLPMHLDFIGVSSYRSGTVSGEIIFTKELKIDVRGRDLLIVDDILDTGRTLKGVIAKLQSFKPREIKSCVLLDKAERRIEKIEADYIGFNIPNHFVVGYGLDYAENYRNLPFIGILKAPVVLVEQKKS